MDYLSIIHGLHDFRYFWFTLCYKGKNIFVQTSKIRRVHVKTQVPVIDLSQLVTDRLDTSPDALLYLPTSNITLSFNKFKPLYK